MYVTKDAIQNPLIDLSGFFAVIDSLNKSVVNLPSSYSLKAERDGNVQPVRMLLSLIAVR